MPVEIPQVTAASALILGLAACNEAKPQAMTPLYSQEAEMSELRSLRTRLSEAPSINIPTPWTTTVEWKAKNQSRSETVIRPENLRENFRINILCMEPVPGKTKDDRLQPSSNFSVDVRANGKLLEEYFGYLWREPTTLNDMHILKSLDIVVLPNPQICLPRVLDPGRAVINDWFDWTDERLALFLATLERNRKDLTQGLPPFKLPKDWEAKQYQDFGGRDIDQTRAYLDIYHERFKPGNRKRLYDTVDQRICDESAPYGMTIGLIPAFMTYPDGTLVKSKSGLPFIELKARVYCGIVQKLFVPPGQTFIHEVDHANSLLEGKPVGQSDKHITDPAYPGRWFTKKSLQYTQLSDGHPDNLLFVLNSNSKGGSLGLNSNDIPPGMVAAAVLNPHGFLVGLTSIGLSDFFANRSKNPDGTINSRARFLSGAFAGSGLLFTGSAINLPSFAEPTDNFYLG